MNRCKYVYKKGKRKGQKCDDFTDDSDIFCRMHQLKNEDQIGGADYKASKGHVISHLLSTIKELPTLEENKAVMLRHLNNMSTCEKSSTEFYKNKVFVDTCLAYPWDKSFDITSEILNHHMDAQTLIASVKKNLDEKIYGMDDVKEEIINMIGRFITNPNSNRNNLALCGPAGVAKTRFMQVISETLDLPMRIISLGGMKDSSFLLGHSYIYVESGPGKLLQSVIDTQINNPIIYFDELDKVSATDGGQDIYSVLSFLTDSTQNKYFTDHYFYGMKFDLSKVFFVFTFNDINKIDKILLDRLNIIHVPCPSKNDICEILHTHCIPEIMENIGLQNIVIPKSFVKMVIESDKMALHDENTESSGIREYYRVFEKILLEINKDILLKKVTQTLTTNDLQKYWTVILNRMRLRERPHSLHHMYI